MFLLYFLERGQLKPAVKLAATKRDQTLLEQSTTKANVDTHEEDTVTSQVVEAGEFCLNQKTISTWKV